MLAAFVRMHLAADAARSSGSGGIAVPPNPNRPGPVGHPNGCAHCIFSPVIRLSRARARLSA